MHTIPNGVVGVLITLIIDSMHVPLLYLCPHYSVIRDPTVSFITPFGMVCILHFYSVG